MTVQLEIELNASGKRIRVDGKGIGRIGDHCSQFRMILFTPADVDLPRGSPNERRRFLDRAIFNQYPAYLNELQSLTEVLRQRNAVLRQPPSTRLTELLEPYDIQLAELGATVACRRRDYVAQLRPVLLATLQELFGSAWPGELRYRSTVPGVNQGAPVAEVVPRFLTALQEQRHRDLSLHTTLLGPQRDDLQMLLGGRPLRDHASQGQHRIFVLALKITEIELLRQLGGEQPILLLDDLSSELDATRSEYLFHFLAQIRCQVFLTTTAVGLVRISAHDRQDFLVRGGRLWNGS